MKSSDSSGCVNYLKSLKDLNWRIFFSFIYPHVPHTTPQTSILHHSSFCLSTLILKKGNKTLLVSPESLCIASTRTYINHNTPLPPPLCTSGATCAWDTRPFMSRKGMFTEDWGWESVCFHRKHLNMHHSLLTLNHEVGLEMNLALRSHARANARTDSAGIRSHIRTASFAHFRLCVRKCKSWSAVAQQTRVIHRQVDPDSPPPSSFVFTSTTVSRKWKVRIHA